MKNNVIRLEIELDCEKVERQEFIDGVRNIIIELTGERMTLDALILEIAKNIFDHTDGKGTLLLSYDGEKFSFHMYDNGEKSYNFEECKNRISRLLGNGINFGYGLKVIQMYAKELGIDLTIDTSKGFSYSGTYKKRTIETVFK